MKGWLLGQIRGVHSLVGEFINPKCETITIESVQNLLDYIEDFKDCDASPDLNVITGDLGEMILRAKGEYV